MKDVLVDMGDRVKQGQILMQLEAPELMQNSMAAHERFVKAQASYNESRDNYFRLLKTSETAGAVSPNDSAIRTI